MNYFGDEKHIIDWLHTHCERVETITDIDMTAEIVIESIMNPDKWSLWINSANKSDPPPDFYCPEAQVMLEVMRIDDHSFVGKKGGMVNETNARESRIQKKLNQLFPDTDHIVVNAVTDLPGKEDHNYVRYLESMKRITAQHIKHIDLYRKNHPGYKLVFFIFDESSAYCETTNQDVIQNGIKEGQPIEGHKHLFFGDKAMLESLRNVDVDYLLWFAPFKRFFNVDESEQLPSIWFYDLEKVLWDELIEYPIGNMVSMEP